MRRRPACWLATKSGSPFSISPSRMSGASCLTRVTKDNASGRIPLSPELFLHQKYGKSNAKPMQRPQLDHILRAAAAITGTDQFVIIGSQAILGQFPHAPADLLISMEADLFSFNGPADADLIDGSIGEGSPFHQTFGYYAHGVAEETATLPKGWKDRLVALSGPATGGAVGLCLEVHDLALSKLVAGRPKDIEFIKNVIRHGLASSETLTQRLKQTDLDDRLRAACETRLIRILAT